MKTLNPRRSAQMLITDLPRVFIVTKSKDNGKEEERAAPAAEMLHLWAQGPCWSLLGCNYLSSSFRID